MSIDVNYWMDVEVVAVKGPDDGELLGWVVSVTEDMIEVAVSGETGKTYTYSQGDMDEIRPVNA